ncbi:MAG: hypothetical protein ACOCV2_01940 [Persicimonas sp.]
MKTWMAGLTALTFLFAAGPVFAQSDDDEPEEQFFEFDGSQIEGEMKGPGVTTVGPRETEKFDELHDVRKKSFMGEIEESSQADSLE